jgi:hypothetical protein
MEHVLARSLRHGPVYPDVGGLLYSGRGKVLLRLASLPARRFEPNARLHTLLVYYVESLTFSL